MSWSNQGRLCGGDVPGGEPFEWMITVTGFHNQTGINQGFFNDIRKDKIHKCDTDMWHAVECQQLA